MKYEYKEIGTIFDKYPVKFPVDQEISIIHGMNGTGKTKTLECLVEYYKANGENVLYFPTDRYFNLTEDEVEGILVMSAMMDDMDIFSKLDIQLQPWDYANKKGAYIDSGFLQVVNIVGTIMLAEKPSIVIIDTIERSLHMLIKRIIVELLSKLDNTKQLIVTTYSPEILSNMTQNGIAIERCVQLNEITSSF